MKVAAWSVTILVKQAGIRFKDGTGRAFAAYVVQDLQRYGFIGDETGDSSSYDFDTLLDYIEPQSYTGATRPVFGVRPIRLRPRRWRAIAVVAKDDYVDFMEEKVGAGASYRSRSVVESSGRKAKKRQ